MKKNRQNLFCLFGLTLSIYISQGLFFVSISGYFSTLENPLILLGNFFLLAMIPFMVVVLVLAPNIDRIITLHQLLIVKLIRTSVLLLLALGILLGKSPANLIYVTILFYDLCFFLYQSISAKVSKNIAQSECLRRIESVNLLGSQLGMAAGGFIGSFLMGTWPLDNLFILAGILEALGIIAALLYYEEKIPHIDNKQTVMSVNALDFKNIMSRILKSPETIIALLLFMLVLPLQQVLNFISGPWAQMRFQDSGQMLGWLVCGTALGSCTSSILLIVNIKLRDSKWLVSSPLVTLIAVMGIYFSINLWMTLLFAIMFGFGFTLCRVIIRASFIAAIEEKYVNAATMIATMLAAVLSTIAISLLSYVLKFTIFQIFIILSVIASIQLILLLLKNKVINYYALLEDARNNNRVKITTG